MTTGGATKCWGDNLYGQLGDGTDTSRLTPVDVSGLGSGIAAIATGSGHTCALATGGGVKCWGLNHMGQLGDGTDASQLTPVDVSGLGSGVTAHTAGEEHACALVTGGTLRCWGNNEWGQLGDGTQTDRLTPVNVSSLAQALQLLLRASDTRAPLPPVELSSLGQQRVGPARRWDPNGQTHSRRRLRAWLRRCEHQRRAIPHMRGDQRGRGEVLGFEPHGPARRWDPDGPTHSRRRLRA